MSHVKFAVLTSSRTGSTWLIDVLNKQTGVEAHGELFLDRPRLSPAISGRADYRRFIEVHRNPRFTRPARVFLYLNGLYHAPRTVGFKLMYTQLRKRPEILLYLAVHRISVVHLTRHNLIDVMISDELAKLTGASHARAGTTTDIPKVFLDPASLIERMRRRSRTPELAQRLLRLSMCPSLEVTYEAMLEGEQEFAQILKFLGIPAPSGKLQSSLEKRGGKSHRDSIVNYDEVEQLLSKTQYSSMLR